MSILQFEKLELKHVPLIKPFFEMQQRRLCDCTIGSTMMWRDYFDNCFAIEEDTLIFRSRYLDGKYAFTFPIGPNIDHMLDRVEEYCRAKGIDLEFCTVTPFDLEHLKARWPKAEVEENRDWFDYLYESQNMVEFSGKSMRRSATTSIGLSGIVRIGPLSGWAQSMWKKFAPFFRN